MRTRRAEVTAVKRRSAGGLKGDQDLVAAESPLSVLLRGTGDEREHAIGILMRTPGDDEELVTGFLYSEGLIREADDLADLSFAAGSRRSDTDVATVTLSTDIPVTMDPLDRRAAATSACGLCGRLQMLAIDEGRRCPSGSPMITADTIASLPGRLERGQKVFGETGGLHAAALLEVGGGRVLVREDVGRHNAVDKVIGAALRRRWLPGHRLALAVSGRVAYEIVHKAVMAGLPAVVAIGAPSSLAVEAARATGLTLVGFVRDADFNVYAGWDRIIAEQRGIPPTTQVK
ncbi:MAG TPA: formate dehydrogenase accessory sulfurtransferase FdhD [Vicinamibacterales bacterium]|nr:formate dehydrogenase accessory sulfurtransferase FdhD [Vicinamibacterales bacterium]